jgi:hypothetical protein
LELYSGFMRENIRLIIIRLLPSTTMSTLMLSKEELEKLVKHYFHELNIITWHKRRINRGLKELEKKH